MGFCLALGLFRILDFHYFLYKDSRMKKQILVLVPKNWLSSVLGVTLSLFITLLLWKDC